MPDTRLSITNSAVLEIDFTQFMIIPDRYIVQNPLSIQIISLQSDFEDGLKFASLLKDWEVFQISEGGLKIALEFYEPLAISRGEEPDLLLVQL